MLKFFDTILARLEEPSTWAAGGAGALIIHAVAPGALGDGLLAIGGGLAVVLGIVLPEKKAA